MKTRIIVNQRGKWLIIGLLSLAFLLVVAWGIWLVGALNTVEEQTKQVPAATVTVPKAERSAPAAAEVVPVQEAPAVAAEAPQPVKRAAVAEVSEPVAPAEPASSSPWTAAMNTAGISASDQAIVLELTMTGFDFNLSKCSCAMGTLALNSPEARFTHLNNYALRNYGSWAGAQAQAAQGGW